MPVFLTRLASVWYGTVVGHYLHHATFLGSVQHGYHAVILGFTYHTWYCYTVYLPEAKMGPFSPTPYVVLLCLVHCYVYAVLLLLVHCSRYAVLWHYV